MSDFFKNHRLTKAQAQIVKDGLINSLPSDIFVHPDRLPNQFGGIWINDGQKAAYLRRLAVAGKISQRYHSRGWYQWYTYRQWREGETHLVTQ